MPWDRGRPGGWCVQPWVGALYALPRPASGVPSPPGPGPSSWRKTPCRCSRLQAGDQEGVSVRPVRPPLAGGEHVLGPGPQRWQQQPTPASRRHRQRCGWPSAWRGARREARPRPSDWASAVRTESRAPRRTPSRGQLSAPRTSRARRLLFLGFSVYVGVGKPPHCHRTRRTDAAHEPRARGARAWL